ncbi:methyltransferase domain-containing protein [Paraburkholderia adhaesiva]|uniref:methyltransferase domain-containing protein n=1 Tax=Paraburkholderia adhaesiva TaxID=2883244 RepID=UPI001F16C2CA|nr:methyltransferase domain-containing protein [Paraburkholderia adhaesiva]
MSEPTRPTQPPGVPEFETRDPAEASFWDERFTRGFTPWDQAGVQPQFEAFATAHPDLAVLIPGCGNAWEAGWLAGHNRTVRAIDFSPAAVASARAALGEHAAVVEQADFFAYAPPFAPGWVFERAFLCALPPAQRVRYAQRMAALLKPGALLAGYFFIDEPQKGPPFPMPRDELDALLTPYFTLLVEEPGIGSLPVFEGRERWMVWCRNDAATPAT